MAGQDIGALAPFIEKVDSTLRNYGYDVPSSVKAMDLRTVGVIGAGIVFGFILLEILSSILGITRSVLGGGIGSGSSYSNYGRSLLVSAARAWENKDGLFGQLESREG